MKRLNVLATLTLLLLPAIAQEIRPLDLKTYVGPSPFDDLEAEWLMPRGRQVIGGILWQIDGAILFYGTNGAQKARPGRTNLNDIPVGGRFERLHLLAGAQAAGSENTILARVTLHHANGSNAVHEIQYGHQLRHWLGSWHKSDPPLKDPAAREVWKAQHAAAAKSDDYLRLYHIVLTNRLPDQDVRSISIASGGRTSALMLLGMSVGPEGAEALADTVPAPSSPFPDLRPRQGEPGTIRGSVKSREGAPAGGALVRVTGARPLNSNYSPYEENQAETGNETRTDARGEFALADLPDDKLYRLLVAAEGFEPAVYRGADPKSDPVQIRLTQLKPVAPAKHVAGGRVVDPEGRPVPYAMVQTSGVTTESSTSWGGRNGFPEWVVASANGEFTVSREEPFSRVQAKVTAPGFAPANAWLEGTNNTVKMGRGMTLLGRVVKDEQPLPGVLVALSDVERSADRSLGVYETKTLPDGRFVFRNVPPQAAWNFYGVISSVKEHGAIPPVRVSAGTPESTNNLGDIQVRPGLRLSGQVQSRGTNLPGNLRLTVSYSDLWHSSPLTIDSEGRFEATGLYPGVVQLSVQAPGYRLTSNNRSLDFLNPWYLTGLLESDKTNLLVLIEPSRDSRVNYSSGHGYPPNEDQPQARPLSGVEPGVPHVVLSGRVVDGSTGQAIRNYRVTPGYAPPVTAAAPTPKTPLQALLEPFQKKPVAWNEMPFWRSSHVETVTNGTFTLEFARLHSTPLLRIEAEGYDPLQTDPIPTNSANLVFKLKPGAGPSGLVRLPDGKPAEQVVVVYGTAGDQFHMSSRGLDTYGDQDRRRTTGKDGKFSFPPKTGGARLFASHPAGWAMVDLNAAKNPIQVRLQPWAAVEGVLVDKAGKPVVGQELVLSMTHDWSTREPFVNMGQRSKTDANGKFRFTEVPPIRLELNRIIPMAGHSWSYQLQTRFIAEPGATNQLGSVTMDQPTPPSFLEMIKRKLGL